jgi:hypothetical protein
VDSGILRETPGVRSRNTLAREQIHSYTYSVITDIAAHEYVDANQCMPQNPYKIIFLKRE